MRPRVCCWRIVCFVALVWATPRKSHGWTTTSSFGFGNKGRSVFTLRGGSQCQDDEPFQYTAEVVGASSPMGSFWLCYGSETAATVVPSGISPGYLSIDGSPIYINSNWTDVWDRVPPTRKKDCVFCGQNVSIPPDFPEDATIVVPNFLVSNICRNDQSPVLAASSKSPKTILYGRHAARIAEILNQHDIETETINDPQTFQEVVERDGAHSNSLAATENHASTKLYLDNIHLVTWGEKRLPSTTDSPKHITIVGGGIVGSAIALFLAQSLPEVTILVLDKEKSSVGRTTPASWAWLNANQKSPKSYQILNQLGIHAWKHLSQLSELPQWMGSLVRFETPPEFVAEGGYPAEGPLSESRIQELEPFCNWTLNSSNDGVTFHFPDEGSVDPSEAVQALREAAQELGVVFRQGQEVKGVVRDLQTTKVTGVKTIFEDDEIIMETDLVVSAAGIGAAEACLGGIPLLYRPGQIAYAEPSTPNCVNKLSKILVDPLRSSHLLQRKDGTLVAGGGALEVGGTSGTVKTSSAQQQQNDSKLLEGARQLSPSLIDSAKFHHVSEAVRPMPQDGLPVVGYVDQGLYVAVTHSGITLGPLLASLAAGEIAEDMEVEILSPYRPSRFKTP